MIPINELRIGNWVSIPECALHAQIIGLWNDSIMIDITNIDLDPAESTFQLHSLEGIPLTPELLKALGFELDGGGCFENGGFKLWADEE